MNKRIPILMAMVLLLVLVAVFAACNRDLENNNASQGLEYILNSDGNGYTVKAIGTCKDTDLKIPSSHKSKPVTAIAEKAFLECNNLTSVAFPKSVTSIGDEAFSFCTQIESIVVEKGNAKYHSAGNCLIETQSKTLVFGCKNSVIPTDGSVESIGRGAFSGCSHLTKTDIPNSVTSIGAGAFYYCTGLTGATIPDSVQSIGEGAFGGCSGLTRLNIGSGVKNIGKHSFMGCSRIESISVASNNAKYHSAGNCLIETQSKTLVFGCKNSVIPTDGRVESIARQAFAFCTGLSDVAIPDGVTDIGDEAFRECIGLGSVTIPNSVTTIGHYAFENCYGLKNITFGGTMEQWNAISKAESWSKAVQSCTVTCTDGTLEI